MAVTNLNNDHFTSGQITEANKAISLLLDVLNTKTRNLSPEERQQYGSIREENKLATLKVLEYKNTSPNLNSPDVNYDELQADWDDRMFLANVIQRLMEATRIADNIRITHDFDAFQTSLQDYRHAEYKTKTDGGAAWENKYEALKQLYTTNPGGGNSKPADNPVS